VIEKSINYSNSIKRYMICVAIREKNPEKYPELLKNTDLAEIRIDLAELSKIDIEKIFSESQSKLIATCRPDNYTITEQTELIKTAISAGAAYVDVEIEASKAYKEDIISHAKSNGCKVIISYHNYDETPETAELKNLIDTCFTDGADIAKLATASNSANDSARILGLYSYKKNLVLLGMGEHGKITRVASPKLGAEFTFAALSEEEATAPGQLTKLDLETIYKIF